jgi:hypothetical protein
MICPREHVQETHAFARTHGAPGMIRAPRMRREAISLGLGHAFDTLRLNRVGIRVLSYNHGAIRAYETCGVVLEGKERVAALVNATWHDDVMVSLGQ